MVLNKQQIYNKQITNSFFDYSSSSNSQYFFNATFVEFCH